MLSELCRSRGVDIVTSRGGDRSRAAWPVAVSFMTASISDLDQLLKHVQPAMHPRAVAFCQFPPDADTESIPFLGLFREAEGVTALVYEDVATQRGWKVAFRAAWITLMVHSDFEAVGLTAAVAGALTAAGISCNVIAAVHHDHLFVPVEQGHAALAILQKLQRGDHPKR
jgi:uncharacterized protein